MEMNEKIDDLDFDLARVIGYHQMRAGFYRRWHKRAMLTVAVALVFPAAGLLKPVTDLVNQIVFWDVADFDSATIAAVVTFAGIVAALGDILVDPASKLARHRATELIYQSIKNDLLEGASPEALQQLGIRYERVDSGFEDRHVLVNRVSGNRVAKTAGRKIAPVPWYLRIFMHYFTFSSYQSQ